MNALDMISADIPSKDNDIVLEILNERIKTAVVDIAIERKVRV